jgi:hypothetical protein
MVKLPSALVQVGFIVLSESQLLLIGGKDTSKRLNKEIFHINLNSGQSNFCGVLSSGRSYH